jgi:uncharacterized protein with FMN-binding domain
MCYNCGCGNPQDDMGSSENITEETLNQLSKKLNFSVNDVKLKVYNLLEKQRESKYKEIGKEEEVITAMFVKAAKAWVQSVEDARKQTHDILQGEIKRMKQ